MNQELQNTSMLLKTGPRIMNIQFWIASLLVVSLLASCTEAEQSPGDQLDQLRVERAELDQKIRTLEEQVAGDGGATNATPVTVQQVLAAPFHHIIDVKGTVDSRSSADVAPRMSGNISALHVRNGQSVKKGQLLAELDAEIVKKQVDEVHTQLEFAVTLYEKQKRIYEKKAGSEIQYLQAKNNKESLERRVSSLNEQLALSQILAPTSGIIDNVQPRVGELVMPGMPIMTVVNTSDMRVIIDLAEPYISSVQVGDSVQIVITEIGATINARIGTVARSVNPVSRTFRVEVPISSGSNLLKPNQTCNVRINDLTIDGAIAIPLGSIVREANDEYVFVVGEKGITTKRQITTGLVSQGSVVVQSGLTANEQIVIKGINGISDGQSVRIVD